MKSPKSVVPVTRERVTPSLFGAPLSSLQQEIDRLFDNFWRGFGHWPSFKTGEPTTGRASMSVPPGATRLSPSR